MVKDQLITDNFAIYNGDNMDVLVNIPDKSIDLSVYSPPFMGLYKYSSDHRDHSNCKSKEEFFEQYSFVVKEMARITKPGRINAVHVTEVHNKQGRLYDFPGDVIKLHEQHGFEYCGRITVPKEPLGVRMRLMVDSLMHKTIVEDCTSAYPAMPDYILLLRRVGEIEVPVTHGEGFKYYFGEEPILDIYLDGIAKYINYPELPVTTENIGKSMIEFKKECFKRFKAAYSDFSGPQIENAFSQFIWRRYAHPVWYDIKIDNVLKFKDSKEEDDEKHVHPLQLDVIDRIVYMYSNPGEKVFTPYMGVGSEVFSPVSLGRFGIGVELKDSYYKQAVKNLAEVKDRFCEYETQLSLFQ